MPADPLGPFANFLATIGKATNETQKREAFIILAARGFGDTELATDLALGAEYKVRFKSSGILRRGAIDAFFGNLVIEFETDLSKTLDHALEQLQGYVAGAWLEDGGTDRPYLAVASDGGRWEVFSPRLRDPAGPIEADNVELEASDRIVAGPADAADLRDFLNRLFFRKTLLRPTTDNFARDFGLTSPAFLTASEGLGRKLRELSSDSELDVLRRAWTGSLQIAYGSVETPDELFVKHTYLAVLARLLVWASMERRAMATGDLEDAMSGKYFVGKRLANLVEDDFFRWYAIPSDTDASPVWIALSRHLAGYDLSAVSEDILKPLYEDLVDPTTRHDLGEYYTPDWLATLMTERLLAGWDWTDRGVPVVLDPTCGSGTFLRAVIELVRARSILAPGQLLDSILSKVIGIDVHPLAVVVARATYVLAVKDLIEHATRPVTVPVFLANSLQIRRLTPTASLFGERVPIDVDGKPYMVPPEFIHESRVFDETIEDVMAVARSYGKPTADLADVPGSLRNRLGARLDGFAEKEELLEVLGAVARHVAQLIRDRRDSVHGFMLKNLYRPAMLRETFDVVIGNPPWLTVGDIATEDYKNLVVRLATDAQVAPRAAGEQSHTEIATIFLSQAVTVFLRRGPDETEPRVGLVMPRSVFTATHHRLLRAGTYTGRFDVAEIWDLETVSPLFNVPACVLFTSPSPPRPEVLKHGLVFAGRLPKKDTPRSVAIGHLTIAEVKFELAYLRRRSAWRAIDPGRARVALTEALGTGQNEYRTVFEQGAILYPQRLIVVKPDGAVSRAVGTVRVRTDAEAAKTAKKLTSVNVNHVVDATNLYLTAAADHILPYARARDLWVALLPTLVDPGQRGFGPASVDVLRAAGRVETANWLEWAEKKWARVRKKGDEVPLHQRLDYMSHLSAQATMRRFVVLYTASGGRPVACVIDTQDLPLPFVARDKTYWAGFADRREADFLAGFLNSEHVAAEILDWMTKGLFGPRDIHKRVLDVPWPRFSSRDAAHRELATVSSKLAVQARGLLDALPDVGVGRRRVSVRRQLDLGQLRRVEELTAQISSVVPGTRRA